MRAGREPGDVTDLDEQPGSTGGSDAVQLRQRGAGRREQRFEFLVGGFRAFIDPLEISDQFGSNPAPGLARGVAGADFSQ